MSEKKEKEKRRAERTKSLTVFERLLLRNIVPEMQGWNFDSMKEARECFYQLGICKYRWCYSVESPCLIGANYG